MPFTKESMPRYPGLPLLIFIIVLAASHQAQGQKYDHFEVENNDLVWRYKYEYPGTSDSLKREVVQMLKSKFFTFNVIRNEVSYNGEIQHYQVDCEKYDRTYLNTPRMYWDGEWSGKFVVRVFDNYYHVTIYALYYEKMERSTGYYRTEKPVKGRYINAVIKKNKTEFRKTELSNMVLMSISLKDNFDIKPPAK